MSTLVCSSTILWLQAAPPRALVLAMTLSYALCFAGMIFAYLSYRRRRQGGERKDEGEHKQ